MHLTEPHSFTRNHPYFEELDNLAFRSKNLYNAALYAVRQHYFATKEYLHWTELAGRFAADKNTDYIALSRKVSQQVLKQVHEAMVSFFKLLKLKADGKYDQEVRLPKYLDKQGRNIVEFDYQALHKRDNGLQLAGTDIIIHTQCQVEYKQPRNKLTAEEKAQRKAAGFWGVKEIRIVPHLSQDRYVVEVVSAVKDPELAADNGKYSAIDLGVRNLAAIIFNTGDQPLLISGKPILNINAFHQKQTAVLKSIIAKGDEKQAEFSSSKRIRTMNRKRQHKITDYLHKITRYIANQLASKSITKVFIGRNKAWKQEVNIGKQNNQNFYAIPHDRFIDMLRYKLRLLGIDLIETTEEYTSKCSFVDLEPIQKQENYVGTRNRRLFISSTGKVFNADVCGAGNILRKATSELGLDSNISTIKEAEAAAVRPLRIRLLSKAVETHKAQAKKNAA